MLNLNPILGKLDFGSVRDLGYSPNKKAAFLVTDDVKSDEELPPDRVIVKYAFNDKKRFGIIATGTLPKQFVIAILAERTGKKTGNIKVWRANGAFDTGATVYTLDVESNTFSAQAIDFTDTTGGDVIFDDDYQPYGIAMIGNKSVTRPATDITFE